MAHEHAAERLEARRAGNRSRMWAALGINVVMLVAESHGMRITTTGQVREDAARGEQVRVLNLSSRTEVVGRALDNETVAVGY